MQYKYCENNNFEDFSSGRVIMQKQGFTNFPVRLAQEIYCRCLSYLENKKDICVYDPCCGGGYLLTVIGFLNPNSIKTVVCSDFNKEAIELTEQNLRLLTIPGLYERSVHLQNLYMQFNKESHLQAVDSAKVLMNLLNKHGHIFNTQIFQADILSKEALKCNDFKADIVITDIPYGSKVSWQGNEETAVSKLLDNLIPILKSGSVVAVCSDKQQRISSDKYIRLEKQQVGKRKFEILTLKGATRH